MTAPHIFYVQILTPGAAEWYTVAAVTSWPEAAAIAGRSGRESGSARRVASRAELVSEGGQTAALQAEAEAALLSGRLLRETGLGDQAA